MICKPCRLAADYLKQLMDDKGSVLESESQHIMVIHAKCHMGCTCQHKPKFVISTPRTFLLA